MIDRQLYQRVAFLHAGKQERDRGQEVEDLEVGILNDKSRHSLTLLEGPGAVNGTNKRIWRCSVPSPAWYRPLVRNATLFAALLALGAEPDVLATLGRGQDRADLLGLRFVNGTVLGTMLFVQLP